MLARNLFLGFSALLWISYGVFCFLQPSFLEQAAGLVGSCTEGWRWGSGRSAPLPSSVRLW
jgi:hypothetical protein